MVSRPVAFIARRAETPDPPDDQRVEDDDAAAGDHRQRDDGKDAPARIHAAIMTRVSASRTDDGAHSLLYERAVVDERH